MRKVICFSGIDGSGKSSHARLAFHELKAKGIKCKYKWLRYPYFLSFVPLTFYHLISPQGKNRSNLSYTCMKTSFHASRVATILWPFFQLADALLSMMYHVYLPALFGYTLILDRCIIDTLVDIAFAMKNERLLFSTIGKSFLKLIPKTSLVLTFDVEENIAASRKDDIYDINSLTIKRMSYKLLSKIHHWNIISTDEPFIEVHSEVMKLVRSHVTGA